MKKMKIVFVFCLVYLQVQALQAQHVDIGISPIAGVWNIPNNGRQYDNSFSVFVEFYKSDSSFIHLQVRYDYFEGDNRPVYGDDYSFQNLGIGASSRFLKVNSFQFSGFALLGVLLKEPDEIVSNPGYSSPRNTPSTVNLTVGINTEWNISMRIAPFVEASVLSSIKINSDEKAQFELFALRIGAKLKL